MNITPIVALALIACGHGERMPTPTFVRSAPRCTDEASAKPLGSDERVRDRVLAAWRRLPMMERALDDAIAELGVQIGAPHDDIAVVFATIAEQATRLQFDGGCTLTVHDRKPWSVEISDCDDLRGDLAVLRDRFARALHHPKLIELAADPFFQRMGNDTFGCPYPRVPIAESVDELRSVALGGGVPLTCPFQKVACIRQCANGNGLSCKALERGWQGSAEAPAWDPDPAPSK